MPLKMATKPSLIFLKVGLNEILERILNLIEYIGYKPLNVPPLNPLKITSLEVQTGPNLKLSLKNITIEGFDTLKMTDME